MISGDRVYVINCHTSKISQIRGNKRYLAKFKNSAVVSTRFTIETKCLSGLIQLIIIESVYLAVKNYFQNMCFPPLGYGPLFILLYCII